MGWRDIVRALAGLLLAYHAVAIALYNVPQKSVLGDSLARPFHDYLTLTATWQRWQMFVTAPYIRHLSVAVELHTEEGSTAEADPLLPGFRPFDGERYPLSFFVYSLYQRDDDLRSYARRVCAQATDGGADVTKVIVRFDEERSYALEDVRNRLLNPGAAISHTVTTRRGPYLCLD